MNCEICFEHGIVTESTHRVFFITKGLRDIREPAAICADCVPSATDEKHHLIFSNAELVVNRRRSYRAAMDSVLEAEDPNTRTGGSEL